MAAVGGAGRTRASAALTHRTIEALKPESVPYRVTDARCSGLAVRVASTGGKTFDLSFRIKAGTVRRLSLGRFPDVTLDAARDRANELTKAARSGRDLTAEEKTSANERAGRVTVGALIEDYAKRELRGRLKTAKEIESRLNRALTSKVDAAAEDLRRRDLRELLDGVADAGFEREAEKRRQTIGAMYRWAISRDVVEVDPTAGLKSYDPGRARDRVLSDEEIRDLWAWLDGNAFPPVHGDVLRLQLLTGA